MHDKLTPPDITAMVSGCFPDQPPQLDLRIGDRVRSYDFGGVLDSFAEGVIEAMEPEMEGWPRYRVRVTRRVWEGRLLSSHVSHVYPAANGLPTLNGGLTNLVVRIAPREA